MSALTPETSTPSSVMLMPVSVTPVSTPTVTSTVSQGSHIFMKDAITNYPVMKSMRFAMAFIIVFIIIHSLLMLTSSTFAMTHLGIFGGAFVSAFILNGLIDLNYINV